jgi:hypothetical protein
MRTFLISFAILSISIVASCDVQSGMSKQGVEKYVTTPTPAVSPTPTEVPIDPADVVQVDTSESGPSIVINTAQDKMNVVCSKYNRVMVNGARKVVTVKGACSQIMLNGNQHDVTAEAVGEIVFNGAENKVRYSRYANGKRPIITDNEGGNLTEKVPGGAKK